jgi:hypothetical protein
MPEIRSISHANTRFALIEDPNPAYNRIFFDGQALDLNTLTPTWQKQFSLSVGGVAQYAGFNGANGTFYDDLNLNGNNRTKYGPMAAFTRDLNTGYTDQFPKTDNSWHRIGYIQLQKGTISTFATQDNTGPHNRTYAQGVSPASTLYGVFDTYWHSLDFNNYPTQKAFKSPLTGFCHFTHLSDGVTAMQDSATSNDGAQFKTLGWFTYNSDITVGVNNSSNNSAMWANWNYLHPTHFNWEDTQVGITYGIRALTPNNFRITWTRNYNSGNTFGFLGGLALTTNKPFFMGVDAENCPYWVTAGVATSDQRYQVYKVDPRTLTSTQVITNLSRGTWLNFHHAYPSNIRRTSNSSIFYTGHWLSTGPAPIRITFEQSTGNVVAANCNVAYPGTSAYTTYAAQIGNNGTNPSGADTNSTTCTEAYMIKPHQFTNSGNTYLTYWLVDQMAYPTGTLSGVSATAYTTNGQSRWATTAQRTMVTYQVSSANDSFLTYHSSYTFPGYVDMPKNFMPINANNTLMAVISSGKTSFLAWNNNSGWASSGTYNQEFRMLGMDSTNRIWGYAMDKQNGSIHVVTPSLSVNVSVRMAATNYTYSGTTINTSATINAYDYTGTRIAANVSLTIDGTTMTFADNGLKTLNVLTSDSGDTTVNLNIYGGGVNNMYAYA